MKLFTIFSTLCISLFHNIFVEKENITNYNYVGLFLIFTNFFHNIIIKLQEYYIKQIIDLAIPSDYNIQKKATEKMSKYVDLQIECHRLWNKKVEVILVITGATE